MSAEATQPSLYERLGGIYSIATVVDDLIDSARFRNWRRRGPFRRRGRHIYVLFDQVPKRCRDQDARQLHAPVFQGQSGEQDGGQLRAPVFPEQSLHSCRATKFPQCVDETSPE
jgi:hypothetical protein